jgi:hypothetical protein
VLLEDSDPVRCAAVVCGITSFGTVDGENEGQQDHGKDDKAKAELWEFVICEDKFATGACWTHTG